MKVEWKNVADNSLVLFFFTKNMNVQTVVWRPVLTKCDRPAVAVVGTVACRDIDPSGDWY